ncbi:hypothetical protein AAFF_G00018720 [Aldrovandia affinis]|uniref:Uncharacterized protein n=1 Tax=Aldrovandia affinis TaxID=143900 RepID=A0AAD7S5E5_9TELE|nr:hypothetical protein AAFF_G00018720 [Aldrovandia affinis]
MAVLKLVDQPPLIQAIFHGDPEEIRMLIYKSEDINALVRAPLTPQRSATCGGRSFPARPQMRFRTLAGRVK